MIISIPKMKGIVINPPLVLLPWRPFLSMPSISMKWVGVGAPTSTIYRPLPTILTLYIIDNGSKVYSSFMVRFKPLNQWPQISPYGGFQ